MVHGKSVVDPGIPLVIRKRVEVLDSEALICQLYRV
jgi:hypothetical protein